MSMLSPPILISVVIPLAQAVDMVVDDVSGFISSSDGMVNVIL